MKKLQSGAFIIHGLLNVIFLPYFPAVFIIWAFGLLSSVEFQIEVIKYLTVFLPQILLTLSCVIGIVNGVRHFKRNVPAKICLILSAAGIVTTVILTVIVLLS